MDFFCNSVAVRNNNNNKRSAPAPLCELACDTACHSMERTTLQHFSELQATSKINTYIHIHVYVYIYVLPRSLTPATVIWPFIVSL